ncbi:SURF1 family protein [Streptomyces sp. ACA25]|uniref:SURF1 family protein n=1 Tax=Streptomyces sp. ACA25 TaxID=3022596 RepID=UPI0023079673|nr:SURF1 family protein [Streptomyces sp. ACA25]MDB1086479.1 SURF1 family protein [Streptomyces sp. ACA25]
MYRFLLTPRWWVINVFVALAIPFCLVMGAWQLGRFEDRVESHRDRQEQAASADTAEAVPLDTLLPVTTDTVGEQALVSGSYDSEQELLVPRRVVDGERGFYVLTPLLPSGGGPAVPVVRGWMPGEAAAEAVPAPPSGEVTVTGALQAAESPRSVSAPSGLPVGQLGVISAASLINVLPYEVEDHWLTVAAAEEPLRAVPAVAPTNTGLDLKAFQNLGYTAEWFVFAAFVIFMWYRLFRRETELRDDAARGLEPAPSGPRPAGPPPAADRPDRTEHLDRPDRPDRSVGPDGPGRPVSPASSPAGAAGRIGSPAPPA